MINNAGKIFLHVILPVIAGVMIYVLFRKDTWFHHQLLKAISPKAVFSKGIFTDIIAFNLPDFCWSYSLASALFIWEKWLHTRIRFFTAFVLLLLLVAELIQYFFAPQFTFDWLDLVAAVLAFFLSYLTNRLK
jgi:hypothetical protein